MPSPEYSTQKRFDVLLGSVVLSVLLLVVSCGWSYDAKTVA
jgi:hypothetical protein